MIERRALLRGLFALPAIVAVGSLMPIRGIIMPPSYPERILKMISGLKEDGVREKIERLWVFKAETEELALQDIIQADRWPLL